MDIPPKPAPRKARILVSADSPEDAEESLTQLRAAGFEAEWSPSDERIADQAALIDEARDAIFLRSLDNRVIFWSKGAQRLYGWTAREALGQPLDQLLKANKLILGDADDATRESGSWMGEIDVTAKDGTILTVDGRWTLLRDADGWPKSILTIDTDITARKRMERQFLRAQRLESIGTLAGGIAHDLNNLLAPIVIGVDLLRLYGASAESEQVIKSIEQCARRGANLVSQVLSFARGVEGSRVTVQLAHILKEVQMIVSNTFPKNIAIGTTVPRDLWPVMGDPVQINQVLINLCVNARDAMPEGGHLTLKARNIHLDAHDSQMNRGMAQGQYVLIEVIDDGCGMSKDVVERIFEPFYTTKEIGKGTGLGLSTVLGILKGHGGFVDVSSEPGKGSNFKLFFPIHTNDEDDSISQTRIEEFPRGNGELVLVVDDESSILTVTRQTLQAYGYVVVTALDGAQALKLFAQNLGSISVVLTDMMMPVMDGPALIAALLHMDPKLRIIGASGLKTNDNVARAVAFGVKHFLAKPYTTETLLTKLKEVLGEPPKSQRPISVN